MSVVLECVHVQNKETNQGEVLNTHTVCVSSSLLQHRKLSLVRTRLGQIREKGINPAPGWELKVAGV